MLAAMVLVGALLGLGGPGAAVMPPGATPVGATGGESMAGTLAERLQGRWRIVEVAGAAALPEVVPMLVFHPDRLDGFAGCNSFGAELGYGADGSLQLSPLQVGRKNCPGGGVMEQEKAILTALQRAGEVRFAGEDAISLWSGKLALLRAERAPTPAEP